MQTLTDFSGNMGTTNVHGVAVNLKDIVSDHLIRHVEKYNPELARENSDYSQKLAAFVDSISNREFQIIDPKDIASNEYKPFDLSTEDFKVKLVKGIGDFFKVFKDSVISYNAMNNPNNIMKSSSGREYVKGHTYTYKDFN